MSASSPPATTPGLSEKRLKLALKASGVGTWSWNCGDDSLVWDECLLPLFGLAPESFPGHFADFISLVHAEDRDRVSRELLDSVATGEAYSSEYRILWADHTVRHLAARGQSDGGGASGVKRMNGACWDITERKGLEEQLRRTQRLEGIGTLASGVAHDLNNILAPILMSIPLLEKAVAGTPYAPVVATIEQCATRGAEIVKQVLTFASGVEGRRIFIQVHHLVREVEKIANETFPRSITIRNRTADDLWPVNGDATQFHQVLLNLCINARDAMPAGGTLTINATNLMIDENYAAMSPEAKAGPYLMLSVADTGHGIAAENMQKIFDPFFTTKEIGKGTGLGLSTTVGIVKSHHGFITVESKPDKGATFTVFLPAEPGVVAMMETMSASEPPLGQNELILIVDDEACIRSIAQTVLNAHGYRVLVAADGIEALAAFAQNSDEIAVVVTDNSMPYMQGDSLIRALRKMNPGVRIISSTGRAERVGSDLGVSAFLHKPYDAHTLLSALHTAIGEHSLPPAA